MATDHGTVTSFPNTAALGDTCTIFGSAYEYADHDRWISMGKGFAVNDFVKKTPTADQPISGNHKLTNTGDIEAANLKATTDVSTATVTATGLVKGANLEATTDVSTATVTATGLVKGANLEATTDVKTATVTATGLIKTTDNVEAKNAKITTDVSTTTLTASGKATASSFESTATTGNAFELSGKFEVDAATGTISLKDNPNPVGSAHNKNRILYSTSAGFEGCQVQFSRAGQGTARFNSGSAASKDYGVHSLSSVDANKPILHLRNDVAMGSLSTNLFSINNETDTNLFSVKGDGSGYFAGNVGIGTQPVANSGISAAYRAAGVTTGINSYFLTAENVSPKAYNATFGSVHASATSKTAIGIELVEHNTNKCTTVYGVKSSVFYRGGEQYCFYGQGTSTGGSGVFSVRGDGLVRAKSLITPNVNVTSDPRLKTDFADIPYGLDTVAKIKIGKYDYLDGSLTDQVGLCAASLYEAAGECVSLTDEPTPCNAHKYYNDVEVEDEENGTRTERQRNDVPLDDADKIKAVNLGSSLALCMKALQEANDRIIALENKIAAMESK